MNTSSYLRYTMHTTLVYVYKTVFQKLKKINVMLITDHNPLTFA